MEVKSKELLLIHLINGKKECSSNTIWVCETTSFNLCMCICHLIDIGILLAELPFVLDNSLQVRETILNLNWRRRVKQIATTIWKPNGSGKAIHV